MIPYSAIIYTTVDTNDSKAIFNIVSSMFLVKVFIVNYLFIYL